MKLAYERIYEVYDAESTTIPRELKRAYYYDKRDRVIQTVTQYPDGILCRTSVKYDYAGNPLITLEKYTYNNKPLTIRTERTFDERSRQLTEQTTIDGAIVSNATFSYDELGRMKRLELGDNVAINTSYNLQGWIDAISSVSSSSGDGQVLSEDIFTERLSYYDPVDANSTPRYSGKISEQRWAHGSIMNGFKGFVYAYDNIGRLTDAQLFTSSQNNDIANNIREQISYDKNSNVIRLSDTRVLSTTTRNYVVQGNQVVQMIVNGNNLGHPTYDERGNMTQNVETGLQMSYNLCNLPKQITTVNGKTVKYTYFADGTKFKAVNAADNGFAYTGSLRWSVQNGVLTPESIAITGGRAVFTDNSWAANYYMTDHLGSVRAVTDAEGEVLDTYDYMPYGSEISSTSSTTTDYRFTGKERQSMVNNSIYDSFARFQNTYGRFMSIDPKAESFYHISPYTYCAGDPVNLVDPDGEKPRIYIEGGFLGHAFISIGDGKDLIIYSYGRYGALDPILSGYHSSSLTPSGEGVLRRLQGNDAATYLNSVMDDVQIFEIDIDSDEIIASYYDALMQNKKAPDNASSMPGTSRVIDEYSLWDNNCVTTTVKGVNKCCNNILGDKSYDIIRPGTLGNYLTELAEEHKYINKINKTKQYIKDLIESLND